MGVAQECAVDECQSHVVVQDQDLADARAHRSTPPSVVVAQPQAQGTLRGVRSNRCDQVTQARAISTNRRGLWLSIRSTCTLGRKWEGSIIDISYAIC